MSYKNQTNYSKIYNNSWGNTILFPTILITILKDIFNNRNRFVEDHQIKSTFCNRSIEKLLSILYNQDYIHIDHIETYITYNNQIIIVSSVYDNYDLDKYNELGWNLLDYVIDQNRHSYVLIFNKKDLAYQIKQLKNTLREKNIDCI